MKELHWICGTIDVSKLDEDVLEDLLTGIDEIARLDACYRDAEVFRDIEGYGDDGACRHIRIYGQFSRDALKALKNLFKEFGVKTFVGW